MACNYSSTCLVGTPLGPSESVPTWQVTPRQRGLCWGGGGVRGRGVGRLGWVVGGVGRGVGGEGGGGGVHNTHWPWPCSVHIVLRRVICFV